MSAWNLEGVAVGDAVAIKNIGGSSGAQKRTVARATKTRVILDDGSVWTRRGKRIGDARWSREFACPWDEAEHQEQVIEAERLTLARDLSAKSMRGLSLDQLKRIKSIFSEDDTPATNPASKAACKPPHEASGSDEKEEGTR